MIAFLTSSPTRELTTEYPLEYIKCAINGKLLGYLVYCMQSETISKEYSGDEMAKMLLKSIENEFCNMRG